MSRHTTHLSSYVKSRKQKSVNVDKSRPTPKSSAKPVGSHSSTKQRSKHSHQHASQTFRFPDELVSKIFTFLSPSQLLVCAQVCNQWNAVSNEIVLWVHHYNLIPRSIRDSIQPNERISPTFQWKKEIIRRTVLQRNRKVKVMLKKRNAYTGLPAGVEQALKFLSVKWQLCFTDKNDQEYTFVNDDRFCFASSLTVRWCSFSQVPDIPKLKMISVSALTPVFYHRDWTAHSDSATRKSLLLELRLSDLKLNEATCTSQDELITLHSILPGVMLAVWRSSWQDGGELAFVSVCFHYHRIIEQIISGHRERVFVPLAHKSIQDDIDPSYGLHGYSATVELRNQRKLFWGNQYRELLQKEVTGSHVILQSHKENEGLFNVQTSLAWKTPVFKNIVNDMVVLDLTLLDEHRVPMWCVSSAVKVVKVPKEDIDYTYSDGEHSIVEYEDNVGKLRMDLIWIEEDKQNIVKGVEVHLRKQFINEWFGTKY